ncbi:MAG TPA: hypothetical protein VGN89_09515, partial [Phenylobacterium sp.]|nr:hypothetical protein [Phenylobacterium sp.]
MLNHLAMHYRPGDSERIANLLVAMGLLVEDLGPARNGDRLFKVYVQKERDDGYFFVTSAANPQLEFEATLAAACSVSLEAYREARRFEPESSFHVAIRYESL